jgi:hypothetical protein
MFIMHRQAGRPYRRHYLFLALLVLLIDLALFFLAPPPASPFSRPGVVLWATIGLTLAIGGIIDHLMLAQTLKPVK